jgi:hypothetical protein
LVEAGAVYASLLIVVEKEYYDTGSAVINKEENELPAS